MAKNNFLIKNQQSVLSQQQSDKDHRIKQYFQKKIKLNLNFIKMNYLAFIIGGLIGWITYYLWEKRKNTKACPYCGERIKKQAIVCRWCKTDLVKSFGQSQENKNVEVIATIASAFTPGLSPVTKTILVEGIKIFTQNNKKAKVKSRK